MSLDFYDRNGAPYAYADDGEHIYMFSGKPIAYMANGSIYDYDGKHLGFFESGIIRDHHGNAPLFTPGASGGPMKPMRQRLPMKGMREMAPMRSMKTLNWSPLDPFAVFGA